jgi:hypothetical protein
MEPTLSGFVASGVIWLAGQFPIVTSILAVMVVCRVIFKPLSLIIDNVVEETPSKGDNIIWDKIKNSMIYKAIAWTIDLLASVKLPKAEEKK